MKIWDTIHIFHFGVQVISSEKNIQAPLSDFQSQIDAVVDNVWSTKPKDYKGEKTFHAINIFNEMFADWLPKEMGKSFRVEINLLDKNLLDKLAESVLNSKE